MAEEIWDAIKKLLAEKIGFDFRRLRERNWRDSVVQRMALCGITKLELYFQRLLNSSSERQELTELLVIPETWFFREEESFDFLAKHIAAYPKKRFRILSIPCSSGEEPYSVAMHLLKEGVSPNRFCIDAVDISRSALTKAEAAFYRSYSFRKALQRPYQNYFAIKDNGYYVKDSACHQVQFFYGNILGSALLSNKLPYDIVLCRYLLVYFHREAQERVLHFLKRILNENGIVIVGKGEVGVVESMRQTSFTKLEACVFCRKATRDREEIRWKFEECREELLQKAFQVTFQEDVAFRKDFLLEKAKALADKGDLGKAKEYCISYLEQRQDDAAVHFLLGVLQHASGNEEEAEKCFGKAVYLEPNHYEALIYLALFAEKRGDKEKRTVLWQRAEKTLKKKS